MIQLTDKPQEEPLEYKRIRAFRERSVAPTSWTLMFLRYKDGAQVIFPDQLTDIEIVASLRGWPCPFGRSL